MRPHKASYCFARLLKASEGPKLLFKGLTPYKHPSLIRFERFCIVCFNVCVQCFKATKSFVLNIISSEATNAPARPREGGGTAVWGGHSLWFVVFWESSVAFERFLM